MIRQLELINFQRWKKLRLKLDRKVTTIVGPNGAGKTAVIRALHWLCFNRPSGNVLKRHGSKSVTVRANVDGHTLERTQGKENGYVLDGEPFKAIGSTVPEEVTHLLNVELENFQHQHDAPFWLSLTPGQVNREMNEIIDLGLMDQSMAYVDRQRRTLLSKEKWLSERHDTAKAKCKALAFSTRMHLDLRRLERESEELDGLEHEMERLTTLVDSLEQAEQLRTEVQDVTERTKRGLSRLRRSRRRLVRLRDSHRSLRQSIDEVNAQQHTLEELETDIAKLRRHMDKLAAGRCPLCGKEQ